MRVISWNINSVRLRINSLKRIVKKFDPDILCLQETKCPKELNENDKDNFLKGIKLESYQKIFFTKISYSLNIYQN